MINTMCYKGVTYELNKKTIAITNLIKELGIASEKCEQGIISVEDFVKLSIKFITSTTNEDIIISVFGTDDIYEIDLVELQLLVLTIMDSYQKPLEEAQIRANKTKLDREDIKSVADMIKTITDANEILNWVD